jgi:hypothetical protein
MARGGVNDRAAAAAPYVERLLYDPEVQAALRRAAAAGRETYERARGRSPGKLVQDQRLRRRAQQAATATWEVWTALTTPPPRRPRWRRRLLLVAAACGGLVLAVSGDARAALLDLVRRGTPSPGAPE